MQLLYDPAIVLLGIYPREMETYVNTKSCTVCNSQKLERLHISSNVWTVKETVIYLDHGIVLSNKKEQIIDTCNNLDLSLKDYAEWKKKPVPKVYIL